MSLVVRLTRQGTVLSGSQEQLQELREQFQSSHYFRLPQLLDPDLRELIQQQIDSAQFRERVHDRIDSNKELCMSENAAIGALLFLMNDERLFEIVQSLTSCGEIRCFDGRVYRVNPNNEHHDSWHNDVGDHRLVGMTVNLSREAYTGGLLQIRDRESQVVVSEIANAGVGDAVVFRLRNDLQHRITNVEGESSKTAFAGWFKAQPNFSTLLKHDRARSENHVDANGFAFLPRGASKN
jgi:hypothetical protein